MAKIANLQSKKFLVPYLQQMRKRRLKTAVDLTPSRFYPYFDGVATYIELPEITIASNESFSSSVTGTFSPDGCHLLSDTNGYSRICLSSNRYFFTSGADSSGAQDRYYLTTEEFDLLTNGEIHTLDYGVDENGLWFYKLDGVLIGTQISRTEESFIFNSFGSKFSGGTSIPYFKGLAYDLTINGLLTVNGNSYTELNYPITTTVTGSDIVEETVNGLDGLFHDLDHATEWYELVDGEHVQVTA